MKWWALKRIIITDLQSTIVLDANEEQNGDVSKRVRLTDTCARVRPFNRRTFQQSRVLPNVVSGAMQAAQTTVAVGNQGNASLY
jgi:hypothetical protein